MYTKQKHCEDPDVKFTENIYTELPIIVLLQLLGSDLCKLDLVQQISFLEEMLVHQLTITKVYIMSAVFIVLFTLEIQISRTILNCLKNYCHSLFVIRKK